MTLRKTKITNTIITQKYWFPPPDFRSLPPREPAKSDYALLGGVSSMFQGNLNCRPFGWQTDAESLNKNPRLFFLKWHFDCLFFLKNMIPITSAFFVPERTGLPFRYIFVGRLTFFPLIIKVQRKVAVPIILIITLGDPLHQRNGRWYSKEGCKPVNPASLWTLQVKLKLHWFVKVNGLIYCPS